jgi:hypothetical protein
MKNILLCLLLVVTMCGCSGPSPDLTPKVPLYMDLSVDYSTTPISLRLRGSVFKNTSGPVETPFDSATIYVSEDRFGTYQTLTTTTQTRLPLPMLAPGKMYYLTTKGSVASYTSAITKPILVVPEVIQPARILMPYDPMSLHFVAPAGSPTIRQYRDGSTGPYVTQLVDAVGNSRLVAYANTDNGVFFCQGWHADSQRAFFEVSRGKKRALVSYNAVNQTFADIPLPAEADLWNYALAPDGQQLVFTDYKRNGLWYFDRRTGIQKRLNGPQTVYELNWTADSQNILLTGPSPDWTETHFAALFDPQTDKQTTIQTGLSRLSRLQLSPNGRYLLFEGTLSGGGNYWVQDRQTSSFRPVSSAYVYRAGWLSDGTFWTAYKTGLWKFTP